MNGEQFQKILNQLTDHEKRLNLLERSSDVQVVSANLRKEKQITLREIVRGRKFKNGQEQIAAIVGYHEKKLGSLIHKDNIKMEWINAKMTNKYDSNFLKRVKDELIRVHPDGTCDLTQTGEDFFEKFLKNEPIKPTSQ